MAERLLIFDAPCELCDFISGSSDTVDLFPLTDDWRLINSVKERIASTGSRVNLLNAAQLIDEEVVRLRERLSQWSANLGNRRLCGRSIIEWFLLKGENVSTWWFSLLSEKNPLKTDVFLRLAQAHALRKQIHSKTYDICHVGLKNKSISRVVTRICRNTALSSKSLPLYAGRKGAKAQLANALQATMLGDSLIRAWVWAARVTLHSLKARRKMGGLTVGRQKATSLLFVSYFPAFNREAAKEGIFKNRYALPLQDLFTEKGTATNWLFLTIPLDGLRYEDALEYGKSFAEHGEAVFFLEEFLSLGDVCHCFATWIKQFIKCLFLSVQMPREFLTQGLTFVECESLLKGLWYNSFIGYIGMSGILFFEAYKNAFKYFRHDVTCIYYLEMQAWEKALNAARRDYPQIKTIGFQHSAFSLNHFSYFHAPAEIQDQGNRWDLPLPDILGCNGDVSYSTLTQQGYSNVRRLEAVRHFYLETILNGQRPVKQQPPVVLLVGAYDKEEAKSLFLLLNEALPNPEGFEVWIKSHPGYPLDAMLKELGLEWGKLKYRLKKEAMNDLLPQVTTVIVSESSVAIDALGFGCQVIVPILHNAICMNPLGRFGDFYKRVYTPAELEDAVQKTLAKKLSSTDYEKVQQFVASYWNINSSVPGWSRALFGHNGVDDHVVVNSATLSQPMESGAYHG